MNCSTCGNPCIACAEQAARPALIMLDVDDVLVDLRGAVWKRLGKRALEIPESLWHSAKLFDILNLDHTEFWQITDDDSYEFWASIPDLPWASELYATCKSIAPTVLLTCPTDGPHCSHGKHQWIKNKFNTRDFLIGPAKWACAGPSTLLIDDKDKNCTEFERRGGRSIVFPRSWNNGYGSPWDVINLLKEMS